MKRMQPIGAMLWIAGMAATVSALSNCSQAAPIKPLPVGSAIPDFKLNDCDGKEHALTSYKGKIVVFDFSSIQCPYSRGVDEWLAELATQYGAKGVVFLGVDSHKDVAPQEIKRYAAENKLLFPVLKDVGNVLADAAGATRTPEIFILDKDLKVAYRGAFDNRKVPEKRGDTNYVRDALDDLLAGKAVRTPEVEAWGCTIKRAK